ncbi:MULTISPECIES: TcfC E-set like domain-containing protein [unclassified Microbulbifer]|uniref:TcfC E-set like domain-containing protein n=1 Tax=unclassified Microbulbifer TaxID=2619833 RepID=UPI0027E49101|nr:MULTISPECIES: TcfC E-set like domain-containing protein [unclassified Microbulbifer]
MNRALAGALLALVLCARSDFGLAASAAFTLDTAAPDGFADLTEAQPLVADLYYGGRAIGAAQITVDLYTVHFSDPAAVLELLPPTLDPEGVLAQLRRPQPRNSHRVCRSRRQRDCGFLTPEQFALIYDGDRFRIDLFFAPELLPQEPAIADPYLPESSSGFSFMQNLTGTWSGVRADAGDSQTASLFGQSILSFGESGLHSQWSATDDGNSQITQLHLTRDYRGRAWSAGLIQPAGGFSSFVASPYLYGLEYRSSNNSRRDNRYNQGAPLEINMPVRGRVEVYRDGRLVHSELLEAGNRLLDTSSLPSGAYEVEIRTFDESGRPLAQRREFFAKDSQLPAPGEWRWTIQAGRPARFEQTELLPEQQDTYFVQAGIARRLFDDTGLFANLASSDDQQLAELGARWISEYLEVSPSLIQSSDGRSGHRLYALLKTPLFSLSLSETRLQESDEAATGYSPLGVGYRQRNAGLTGVLMGGRLSLRYSERDRNLYIESPEFILDTEYTGATRLTTLEYRRDFFRNRHWHGDLTLAHSDADGRGLTTATFEFRFRGDHWNHSARLRADSGREDGQNGRTGFNSSWRDGDRWATEVHQQFSSEVSADEYALGSRTRVAGRRGQLSSTLDYRHSDANDGGTLNYLGSFSTNLMTDGDAFAWGGERALNSAVLVDIAGGEDQQFEILVDGVRRGYAKGGGRSVVNLPSFKSYDIQLRPIAEGFYDYREIQDTVTLYPGNVAAAEYKIQPVILVLGRLIRDGQPVAHRKISIGEYTAVTDEFGVFQMEVHSDPQFLRSPEVQWGNCLVPLPGQTGGKHWLNLGDIDWDKANCDTERNSVAAR